MRKARVRNDRRNSVYRVTNCFLGIAGEFPFASAARKKLDLFIRQLNRLYVVDVLRYEVTATGYEAVVAAPAALPSRTEVTQHFLARYGTRRQMPCFDDDEVYGHWARRLRDISNFVKDLEQRFTQWYNRKYMSGKRKGTVWQGRFRSEIVSTAKSLYKAVFAANDHDEGDDAEHGAQTSTARRWKTRWKRLKRNYPLLEELPLFAVELPKLCWEMTRHPWGRGNSPFH